MKNPTKGKAYSFLHQQWSTAFDVLFLNAQGKISPAVSKKDRTTVLSLALKVLTYTSGQVNVVTSQELHTFRRLSKFVVETALKEPKEVVAVILSPRRLFAETFET